MSRESSLLRNTAVLSLGTILPKAASIILLPILTGYLTKDEYGSYDLIVLAQWLLLPAFTLQVQGSSFRFLIDSRNDEQKKSEIVTNIFTFTAVVSFVVLLVTFFAIPGMQVGMKILTCAYFFVDIITCTIRQCVRGLGDNASFSISVTLNAIVSLVLAFVLIRVMGMGLLGCLVMLISAVACESVYLMRKSKLYRYFNLQSLGLNHLKEYLAYSWPLVPNSLADWFIRAGNRLVIASNMGLAASASFAVANKIPQMIKLVQQPFSQAWQENASLALGDEDVNTYYSNIFDSFFNFVTGSSALIIGLTPLLYRVLISGDYADAYAHVPMLFLAQYFYVLASFLGGLYVAHKKTKSVGITTIVAAAINLGITALAIPHFGLLAVSVATLACFALLFAFRVYDVRSFVRLEFNLRKSLALYSVLVLMCVLCAQQQLIFDIGNFILGAILFMWLNGSLIRNVVTKLRAQAQR